jgi:uncharacterized protein (DUF488 family)
MIELYTIGFTQKTAQHFFDLLISNQVKEIIDTRVNNTSQLAGFAKGEDLKFFASSIGNMNYSHQLDFAPTKELLARYRKKELSWEDYEIEYLNLLDIRKVAKHITVNQLHQHCLLCSEHSPTYCHRRLLAEYFKAIHSNVKIVHLQ